MYLKQIEAYGFKSFADKITLDFTENINGIVGPNGSGKSNIVDAVRWVLTPGSNKQIRATDTTSVIFSGSKSRKPLNSAMVTLTFDNTDRTLATPYNEVSVKRILYRSGENEYYLNNTRCRLKDITELFIDSGAAKESFNIIGQGKIDDILSSRPIDRRIIFEEAAGVLKYKKRKEEALRKLERTNNNINRVSDIIHELETNLEPLRVASNLAKEYLTYSEELKNKHIALMIHDVDAYSSELNTCREKITSLTDKINEINVGNSNYDVAILENKQKLENLNQESSKYTTEVLELTKKLDQTDSDIKLLRERKKYLNSDNHLDKINNLKEEILKNNTELNKINTEIKLLQDKISIMDEDIINHTTSYNETKNNIAKIENKLETINRTLTNKKYEVSYLEETLNNDGTIPTSVKNIKASPLFTGIHDVIGALVSTESNYAIALSTALGGASSYLVVDTASNAAKMVEYLKKNNLGRATFYPLDVIKPRVVDNDSISKVKLMPGYIGILSDLVTYKDTYMNIIQNQLGNVLVVDNIDNANNISKEINNRYRIVTIDGQIVNVGGSITGGSKVRTNNTISIKYELADKQKEIKTLEETIKEHMSELANLNTHLKASQDKIAISRSHKTELNDIISKKENEKSIITSNIDSLVKELKDIETISNNETDNMEGKLLEEYYHLKEEIDNRNNQISFVSTSIKKTENTIKEFEDLSRNSLNQSNSLSKSLHDNELKVSRLEVKIDTILNSLNEEYTITYKEAREKYLLEEDTTTARERVASLKEKIKAIGTVNLGAIEEYDRISTRYEFLTKQKEDLTKAENTLLEIINDMDNIMKEKFVSTFNEVRTEFKKVFKELFGGGNADVYMEDETNILETGICLEATPPGKNLKNVSALSGGEKTFTAIALLFAILNIRPVPFCLFDEVEAALDEANVDRFGEYLNKYRNKTQFIIITHKKRTMEYIDTLYGITMQESGVSKRVSVKLGELKEVKE